MRARPLPTEILKVEHVEKAISGLGAEMEGGPRG